MTRLDALARNPYAAALLGLAWLALLAALLWMVAA